MRTGLLVPAVIGLAAAFPSDVDVDSATIEKALEVYKSTGSVPEEGVAVGNEKRTINWSAWCPLLSQWICAKLPTAYGPTISPDTVDAFHASTVLAQSAQSAVTPSGYVSSFQNLAGAVSTSNFLGYYELSKYDPSLCAKKCDGTNSCLGFNIWYERDPSTLTSGQCCSNPPGVTRIKCSTWGTYTTSSTANNVGAARDSFAVVMAGSNGYNKQAMSSSTSAKSSSATPVASSVRSSQAMSSVAPSVAPSVASSVPTSVASSKVSSVASSTGPTSAPSTARTSTSTGGAQGAAVMSTTPSATQGGPISSGGSYIATTPQASVTPGSVMYGNNFVSNSASAASANAASAASNAPVSVVTASIASSATNACATPVATPDITFDLYRQTTGDETMYVYGSIDQLGDWDVNKAVAMSPFSFGGQVQNWVVDANITAGTYFEYKYFQRNADWSICWPPAANRMYTAPTGCNSDVVIQDQWTDTTCN